MKRVMFGLAVAALVFVSGCIESTTLLDVKKDGSGKIVVREFMSPQVTQMMDGMGNMFAGMEVAGAKPAEPVEKKSMFKDMIDGKLKHFGEGVELVSSEELTNKQGWKGYTATYSFKDINNISIAMGDSEATGGGEISVPGDTKEEKEDDSSAADYTFKFVGGDSCKLQIISAGKEDADDVAVEPVAGTEGMEEMGDQMMAGMGAMMGPMLKGMRLTFIVRVEGKIKQTNSAYPWKDRANTITVMDMPVDKMLGNPEAMKLMQSQDDSALAKIEKLGIEGVKLEKAGKTIEIEF